jgi:Mg/Co/Ni transporter MgtE
MSKKTLSVAELEAQTAFELPARETPATVVLSCLAVCVGGITISNVTIPVGIQVCAIANVLAGVLGRAFGVTGGTLTCNLTA